MLKFTSCMAANADPVCRLLTDYLGQQLNLTTKFVDHLSWQAREQGFDRGAIQVCWMCGLPYIWRADRPNPGIELLVAPIMQGERYGDRPVYFSDVVVRQDSLLHSFEDLRGRIWAYNEPHSHSGCYVTRYYLAHRGKGSGYFSQAIESGAHQTSLQLILSGQVDASAIDSTVLALELQHQPDIAAHIRVIDTFGPSPIPPWLISTEVPDALRQSLRQQFLQMHTHPEGQEILRQGLMNRFVAVSDQDYDLIRQMATLAETVTL